MSVSPRSLPQIAVLLGLGLGACSSTEPRVEIPDPRPLTPISPEAQEAAGHLARVQQNLDDQDWVGAREALIPLAVASALDEARTALATGRPRDAFGPLEAALALDQDAADLHFVRGQAAWATAVTDSQPIFFYEDAADSFEAAFRTGMAARGNVIGAQEVACLVGISRAKRMALDPDGALTLARNAHKAMQQLEGPPPSLEQPISRVWAAAAFNVFVAARGRGEDADALFAETEDQLSNTTAYPEHQQWALVQLSNLHQWRGGPAAAIAPMERALEFAPTDGDLHARLVSLLEASGGRIAVLEWYLTWRTKHPESSHGWWYGAVTLFEHGLAQFQAGTGDEALFRESEQLFEEYKSLAPQFKATAQAYQASCRSAVGFIQLNKGDLNASEKSFLSMQELFPGAIEVQLGARIPSGLTGLDFVIGKHAKQPENREAMESAARVADFLHSYSPTSADYANNAGFFNRDAAVLLESEAQEAAKNGAEARSKRLFKRALEVMNASWQAYQVAAELAPRDVRMVNDAGLVMTYYLRTDIEAARVLLEQARAEGDRTLASLTSSERADLEWADPIEAWGDAYQNLGILHLTLLDDPAAARPFFERALEIGPPRRAWLQEEMLPRVDRMIAGEDLPPEDYAFMVWLHQNPDR